MARIARAFVCFWLLVLSTGAALAAEGSGLISDSLSDDLQAIVTDQVRQRAYVADYANSKLLVIDSVKLSVTKVDLPGRPHWLAITKDSKRLGVALDTFNVAIVDLETLTVTSNSQFLVPIVTFDFDAVGNIFFSTTETFGSIWFGDPLTGQAAPSFEGQGRKFFSAGLVRTNHDGTTVYVADGPGGITQAVISSSSGTVDFVAESTGTIAGVQDFRVSPADDYLYVATTIPKGIVRVRALTMAAENVLDTEDTPMAVDVSPDGTTIFATTSAVIAKPDLYLFSASTLGLIKTETTTRRTGIFFSAPRARGLAALNDGKLRLYLEGYDGGVDAAQKGWQIGVQGEVPDKPVPEIVSSMLSAAKLPKKGGTVSVNLELSAPQFVSIARVQSVCKFKVKSKSPIRKTIVLTSTTPGMYSGSFKYGKTVAGATCTLTAIVQLTDTEPIQGRLGKVTVASATSKRAAP